MMQSHSTLTTCLGTSIGRSGRWYKASQNLTDIKQNITENHSTISMVRGGLRMAVKSASTISKKIQCYNVLNRIYSIKWFDSDDDHFVSRDKD